MPNKEICYMLPKTRVAFDKDLESRQKRVITISQTGADLWEGDQWHSTTYREQQSEKERAIRHLQMLTPKLGILETLPKPQQNDTVEVGHMVKVKLPNDPEIAKAGVEHTLVHVLAPDDFVYLGDAFDGIQEMIIPFTSPLAKALIGLKRGEKGLYYMEGKGKEEARVQVLDIEDAIALSSLFG